MNRVWIYYRAGALLVLCTLMAGVSRAESPFEGRWKVLLPEFRVASEANLWLLKIAEEGKSIEVLAGIQAPFKEAKVQQVKADAKSVRFSLVVPRAQTFHFTLMAPAKGAEGLLGSVRIGSEMLPVWLVKTEQTEIDPATALARVEGLGDLQAALKQPDDADKRKELTAVIKANPAKPVALMAYQQRLGVLVRTKAKQAEIREAIEEYIQGIEPFGPMLVLGTRMQMANAMRGTPETHAISLHNAETAVKMLSEDTPRNVQLSAYLALSTTQYVMEKKEEAAQTAPKIKALMEAIIADLPAEQKRTGTQSLATAVVSSPVPEIGEVGLEFARAAHQMLPEDAPEAEKLAMDKFLRNALNTREKKEEAEKLDAAIEKVEARADAAFEKENITFDLKKWDKRKGKSERVVVVELFTGSQCPPCVAADIAFDAARKTFPSRDVVFLQYHLHIPGPDPMTNPDSIARQSYYGDEAVGGTPALLLDGEVGPVLGGGKPQAEERYGKLFDAISENLEQPSEVRVKVQAKSEAGDKIAIEADVSGVKAPGEKLRLRFALLEEVVRYPGGNGQRLHHHVVRAMPAGAEGIALTKNEGTYQVKVDVAGLRKAQATYLSQFVLRSGVPFVDAPLGFKNLKVVAFVQDDTTKKILQAAQVDVK